MILSVIYTRLITIFVTRRKLEKFELEHLKSFKILNVCDLFLPAPSLLSSSESPCKPLTLTLSRNSETAKIFAKISSLTRTSSQKTNTRFDRTMVMMQRNHLGNGGGRASLLRLLVVVVVPLVAIHGAYAFEATSSRVAAAAAKKCPDALLLTRRRFRPLERQHGATSSTTSSLVAVRGGAVTTPLYAIPAAAAAAAAVVTIPSLQTIALSCLLPTSLGYVKSEYGVSYGYGTSIAILAAIILQQQLGGAAMTMSLAWSWPALHGAALLFYGLRLDVFLLYRELCIPKFRKFREKIEEKAAPNRLARTPFVVSCALLYACMASPLFVTATVASAAANTLAVKISIGVTWAGFFMAALGDLTKSVGKARRGPDALITGGIFRFFRHPNYTGESIAWTASCMAAFCAALADSNSWKTHVYSLMASTVGLAGILLVLAMATKGLVRKQQEKYGDSDEYQQWIKLSWVGISL
jgi:steroid 5-alpha reductase family enzyme